MKRLGFLIVLIQTERGENTKAGRWLQSAWPAVAAAQCWFDLTSGGNCHRGRCWDLDRKLWCRGGRRGRPHGNITWFCGCGWGEVGHKVSREMRTTGRTAYRHPTGLLHLQIAWLKVWPWRRAVGCCSATAVLHAAVCCKLVFKTEPDFWTRGPRGGRAMYHY